ncbi:MAG: hypothetical protein K0S82_5 [Gaiellaceae bacterium]|jgi:hypothetical protein|nr:hypothetical protein [Gaiellaceae bacterium]
MSDAILRIYNPEECQLTGYPAAWDHDSFIGADRFPAIKHYVRMLAGDRCERCGHPYRVGQSEPQWSACDEQCVHDGPVKKVISDGIEFELVLAKWRVLTVHHLNGVKYDCRWWNLAALCQRCHLSIQGRVVMERAFIFEHSDWFKSHAAGWYADKYLGEDLSREETFARMDELLALEQLA